VGQEEKTMLNQLDEAKVSKLVNEALADKRIRKTLIDDPIRFIRENGIAIPDGTEARVVTEKDSISLEMRMPKPAGDDAALSDQVLDSVVGGAGTSGQKFLVFTFKLVAV
jgi:hypothetical protein